VDSGILIFFFLYSILFEINLKMFDF
jgi:hypothetical protein